MSGRKLFNKRDLVVAGALVAAAAVYFLVYKALSGGADYCEIRYDGRLVKTVDLSVNATFVFEQNPSVVFEVKNGAIAFIESDCPDQICVRSGFLSKSGQSAACLPNKVMINVASGSGGDEIDAVAR